MYKTIILLIVFVLVFISCRTNRSEGNFFNMRIAQVEVDGKQIFPTISIDGKSIDIDSEDVTIFLASGKHDIKVEAKGFKSYCQTVQILENKKGPPVKVVLEK